MSAILLIAGILSRIAALRPLYLAVWCALAVLSVVLIVSTRSHWGRRSPLYRCAVFSLLVHLILVGVTMTVRLVVGDNGAGTGPPIHVRLVDDVPREGPILLAAPAVVPKVEEAKTASEEMAAIDVAPPELASQPVPVEAPPLMEPPAPVVEKKIVLDEQSVAPPQETVAEKAPEPVTPVAEAPAPAATGPMEVAAEVVGDVPPATSPYAHRNAPDRLEYAEQHGGSVETEAAVAAALEWLANAQSPDGRWDASRFGAGQELVVLGQDRGGAGADADSGISALAILAFLGAGHSHQQGDYQTNVAKGLEFLMRCQSADGRLSGETSMYARMYCHSMASFALAEDLAMTGDQRLAPAVRRAVDYSLRAQHPSTGGWRYNIGDTGDTSQMGWQLMSLWSADRAGIEIPPRTWTGAARFLRSVERGRFGGLASYRPDGPPSTPMTAEALYCRHVVGEMIGGRDDGPAMDEATAQMLTAPPEPNRVNLYYWYYATLALHYRQSSSAEAEAAWQAWNSALTSALVNGQVATGPEAGSWPPNCVWGGYGGRVYSTAVAAMCLEVYYRYAPAPAQEGWTASRGDSRRLPAK
jgi:hypothetical protein